MLYNLFSEVMVPAFGVQGLWKYIHHLTCHYHVTPTVIAWVLGSTLPACSSIALYASVFSPGKQSTYAVVVKNKWVSVWTSTYNKIGISINTNFFQGPHQDKKYISIGFLPATPLRRVHIWPHLKPERGDFLFPAIRLLNLSFPAGTIQDTDVPQMAYRCAEIWFPLGFLGGQMGFHYLWSYFIT